jgi:hypothetical protein
MRIVIEIDDTHERAEPVADPGSGASGAGADTGEEAVDAGPGPGADAESSDEPAADGGAPSASLLDEVATAEQLGHEGDTSDATDAGAGPHES